jgi:hypothetical protein
VEASAEQLQVSSAELGTVIATKQVNDLPLNGRNFTQLLSLTPAYHRSASDKTAWVTHRRICRSRCRGRVFFLPIYQWRDQPQQLLLDGRHE